MAAALLARRIPLWLKVAYTLFAVYFVAVQLQVTPALLLWFCNAAVVITLAGLWLESRLLLSTQLLAVFWPQLIWQIDVLAQAAFGLEPFAVCGLAPAGYMFDPDFPWVRRIASFQHAWMPWFVLWLSCRVGYDRRALLAQTLIAIGLLLLTLLLVPDMDGPAGNVNYIFGPFATHPQPWMPKWAWTIFLMLILPLIQFAPLHVLLGRLLCRRIW